MNPREEAQADVVVARTDWENFIASLERLMTLHQRTLQQLKELRVRNEALRTELRSAMALPTLKPRPEKRVPAPAPIMAVQQCRYCSREIELSAKFCDRCGNRVAAMLCQCGRELASSDRFCDRCGRSVTQD